MEHRKKVIKGALVVMETCNNDFQYMSHRKYRSPEENEKLVLAGPEGKKGDYTYLRTLKFNNSEESFKSEENITAVQSSNYKTD